MATNQSDSEQRQGELLQFPVRKAAPLEVHEHRFTRGPRSSWAGTERGGIAHSHPGGDIPHQHADTGPASYTIDKDEWFRETGLRGGGRKKFTKSATGEQFPIVELEGWQKTFEIHVLPMPAHWDAASQGPGTALPMRMILAHKMTVSSVTDGSGPSRNRASS